MLLSEAIIKINKDYDKALYRQSWNDLLKNIPDELKIFTTFRIVDNGDRFICYHNNKIIGPALVTPNDILAEDWQIKD